MPGWPTSAKIALRATILLSATITLRAQDFRATVSGQVSDRSGAPIPHAAITALRLDNHEVVPALNVTVARIFQFSERTKLKMRGEQLPLSQRNFPRLIQIAAKILF